jgi:hypothetical protein
MGAAISAVALSGVARAADKLASSPLPLPSPPGRDRYRAVFVTTTVGGGSDINPDRRFSPISDIRGGY